MPQDLLFTIPSLGIADICYIFYFNSFKERSVFLSKWVAKLQPFLIFQNFTEIIFLKWWAKLHLFSILQNFLSFFSLLTCLLYCKSLSLIIQPQCFFFNPSVKTFFHSITTPFLTSAAPHSRQNRPFPFPDADADTRNNPSTTPAPPDSRQDKKHTLYHI
jgi:hypothetical protein